MTGIISSAFGKQYVPVLTSRPRTRILAVDYGRRKIGLALSDESRTIARPLGILARTNRQKDLQRLREICRENDVARVIVGLPLHITGVISEMAEDATRFARRLAKELGLIVELVDERLTTWEAKRTAAHADVNRKREARVDDLAAAILLREYLQHLPPNPAANLKDQV